MTSISECPLSCRNNSKSQNQCVQCQKKEQLLQRYEKLVILYKKKKIKSSHSSSECSSVHLSQIHSSIHNNKQMIGSGFIDNTVLGLLTVIESLIKKRMSIFFRINDQRKGKKLASATIIKAKKKIIMKYYLSFFKAISNVKIKSLQIEKINTLQQNKVINQIDLNSLDDSKNQHLLEQQLTKYNKLVPKIKYNEHCYHNLKDIISNLQKISKQHFKKNQIIDENKKISIQNCKLSAQNKYLKQCIQQIQRRQSRQICKKKQSLEMLAEELSQKNNYIKELERELKAYQNKNQKNMGNILEEGIVLRKQIQHLEQINEKIDNQNRKIREQLIQLQKSSMKAKQQYLKHLQEAQKIQRQKNQNKLYHQKLTLKQKQIDKFVNIFQRKVKMLSIYQNQQQNSTILKSNHSYCHQAIDNLKSEAIFCFLSNIDTQEYELKCSEIFNSEQQLFIEDFHAKYLKLKNQVNLFSHPDCIEDNKNINMNSEIQGKGKLSSGIFSNIDSQKQRNQGSNSITMKILEIQLQKSKLIEKISELKQKYMHIRVLILKLLKNIQIQPKTIKPQLQSILNIIYEFFEYSQEERSSIIGTKKKKFFNFL